MTDTDKTAPPTTASGGSDLQTIRDILFGERASGIDAAIAALEARTEQRIEEANRRAEQRLEELRRRKDEQIEELTARLDKQRREIDEAHAQLEEMMKRIRGASVDRGKLSTALSALATQLQGLDDDPAE